MAWVLRLIETGADGQGRSIDVLEISRPNTLRDIAGLGLTLPEAKQLLARVQQAVVAGLSRDWGDEDVSDMTGRDVTVPIGCKTHPVRDPSAGNNPSSHIAYVLIPPISGQSLGQERGQVCLQLAHLRCRAAVRGPARPCLAATAA